jgi:hypothetical protein
VGAHERGPGKGFGFGSGRGLGMGFGQVSARARPGIGLGRSRLCRLGVGRQPWGSVVDSAKAKRFRILQLELRRGDQCDK